MQFAIENYKKANQIDPSLNALEGIKSIIVRTKLIIDLMNDNVSRAYANI